MRFRLVTAVCFVALAVSALAAETVLAATQHVGVGESARVSVVQPVPAADADLILLNRGFDAGFRQGMVCIVSRAGLPIGELLLVDLRGRAAAGLIIQLQPDTTIRPGDRVFIKRQSQLRHLNT